MGDTGPDKRQEKPDLFTDTGEIRGGYDIGRARANALAHVKKSYNVYVMNADGSGQARLTTPAGIDFYPAWGP